MKTVSKIEAMQARVGIIGLGYVGLPLAIATRDSGFFLTGYDTDASRIALLQNGESYIEDVSSDSVEATTDDARTIWTADPRHLAECNVIVICVPTPLTPEKEPDLSCVLDAVREVSRHVRRDTLIVLESTIYPGATETVVSTELEEKGFCLGKDLFLGYSPEREDPGNWEFSTRSIPKVVSGYDPMSQLLTEQFYRRIVDQVVSVSNMRTAEAVKVTENVFRSVNIALMNELKQVFRNMDIDIWEVVAAAATKPFGYMPFFPGPGVGGHCIPVDPHYLLWAARRVNQSVRIVQLATDINDSMPQRVMDRLAEVLGADRSGDLAGTKILLVGLAYKRNVADIRESPALSLLNLIATAGAVVSCLDPVVSAAVKLHGSPCAGEIAVSEKLNGDTYDAVVIVTDHDIIDFGALLGLACPIIDTRNAMKQRGFCHPNVHLA
jgi:UDP-N-acetyl-D-glucosamine dehydrogenase